MAELGKGPGITWYDVLGVLPGASAEQVQRQHDAKARLLRPELVAGASSPVVAAATRAREILGAAQRVLADPANRARYDEAIGVRRSGGGLARRAGFPSEPGLEMRDGLMAGTEGAELLGGLLALSDWLAPHPGPPKRVAVPDVRGLFFSVCLGITGKLGLRLTTVSLTEHPMPVDGLVVAQSPEPSVQARRGSAVTVHVWRPPRKLALHPHSVMIPPAVGFSRSPPRRGAAAGGVLSGEPAGTGHGRTCRAARYLSVPAGFSLPIDSGHSRARYVPV